MVLGPGSCDDGGGGGDGGDPWLVTSSSSSLKLHDFSTSFAWFPAQCKTRTKDASFLAPIRAIYPSGRLGQEIERPIQERTFN